MKTLNQHGAINVLLIPLILVTLLLFGALGFGYWAFSERQDYKENSDQKVATAVTAAEQKTQANDAKKYAEEAKLPLKKYTGPAAYGSIVIEYPKTWSSYVVEGEGNSPVNGYFQPDFVPNITGKASAFALRVELVQQSYNQVLQQATNQASQGNAVVTPYGLPKVPSVIGAKISGKITPTRDGQMIILPLRNMTLKMWTESVQFVPDFNNIILPNAVFTP